MSGFERPRKRSWNKDKSRRTLEGWGEIDILPIDLDSDLDSEKKKVAKIICTTLNSSKTTGNIPIVHFM